MIPTVRLLDGSDIPQIGYGTLKIQPDNTVADENVKITARHVREAFAAGYRHLDTAQGYGTEPGIGRAIAEAGYAPDELYVTSKLRNGNHDRDDVRRTFDITMANLGIAQLDLFLIHWPLPTRRDYVDTWRSILALRDDGRLRSAGVSNFQPAHLDRIIEATGEVPVVNQIEIHPYFTNRAAVAACTAHGIAVESWSPLGQGAVLEDDVIRRIAVAHGRTPAQVVLRWHVQHGFIVIPRSVRVERMHENIAVVDFSLDAAEMAAIDALDKGEAGRTGPHPDTFDWMPEPSV
jgi:2,5-diketo-D-gluconate reductase A